MSKIKATCIKNPFQPRIAENRDEREFEFKNQTIADIFCEYYPIPNPDIRIVASINGKIYEQTDWKSELNAGDHLVFVPVPQGSGGGGSNPMMIVAMIVVAAVAWYAGGAAWGAAYAGAYGAGPAAGGMAISSAMAVGSMAQGLVSAAIMVAGGMLVSSIFPTAGINTSAGDLSQDSPTYGWGAYNNATQEGTMLPVIVGERRVVPPLIAAHSDSVDGESYIYLLYAVSEGPIESIYGIEINDQPESFYEDVEIKTRLGNNTQTILPYFGDTFSDSSVGVSLNTDYVVRETDGNAISAAQVHISLPMGLWYANNKGGLDEQTMSFSIQYRKYNSLTDAWGSWFTYYPDENTDGTEEYESGRVYNPGEIVFYDNAFYKCTNYYAYYSRYYKDTELEPAHTETGYKYVESLKKGFTLGGGSSVYTAQNTPNPLDSDCWILYVPKQTSVVITSNSNSTINKSYRINFPSVGKYQVQVKISTGPPEDNARYGSKAVWTGLTEILTDDFTYPGVALLGIKIKATDQLSGGIPKISCIARKISATLPLAGTIDLRNPAWASYYILNNPVWGGGVPESKIILADFQLWASYCSSKGITGTMYLDQRMSYNDIKNYFCEIGRANIIQQGIKFGVIIDKPAVSTQLFTIGNIIKDSFSMLYLPMDERANVIRVNYYDKDKNWEKCTIELRTNEFITGNKEISQEITLYPCETREIAAKHARLLLNYNKGHLRTCAFNVSIDALACTIGDVIKVQHDATRYGFGGRIIKVNGRTITLDRRVSFADGITYGIIARCDNDDSNEHRTFVVDTTGEYDEITINADFSSNITTNSLYSVGELNIEAKPFRILALTRSGDFTRKITALEYYDIVYDDSQIVDVDDHYMAPPIISGLTVVEVIDNIFAKTSIARLTWKCPGATGVNVYMSHGSGENTIKKFVGRFKASEAIINDVPMGVLVTFKVIPVGNSHGDSVVSLTFWGEDNAIYESGCYESGVFANHPIQEASGYSEPYSLWLQEPQSVAMNFIN